MKIELNRFVSHLAQTYFQVRGVYRYKVPSGSTGIEKAAPYPGFIFPISGCCEYHFNDSPFSLSKGTVLHGSGNGLIKKKVVGEEAWEYILILYETYKEPEDFQLVKTNFLMHVKQTPQLLDMLYQLHEISKLPGGFSEFQTETLARKILDETFLSARNQIQEGTQELFETVSNYIQNHYMENISVGFLAEQNNVTENRLFYVFQKYVGTGPKDYLQNYRLNRAKDLLVTSSIPINQIALQVGYADPLYFSRVFKNHFGASPRQFR